MPKSTLSTVALSEAGGDCEKAANAVGRNGYPVWQPYVTGLEPEDEKSKFFPEIVVKDGKVHVSREPINGKLGATRVCTTFGKGSLDDRAWTPLVEGRADGCRFFKAEVSLTE